MSPAGTASQIAAQIAALAGLLHGTGIAVLELTMPDSTVRLRRTAGTAPPSPKAAPGTVQVTASAPGLFRHAHPAQPHPLVQPGQAVAAGAVLGLLQVGGLLIHVTAPQDGTVLDLAAADGARVGFGTALVQLAGRGVA